MSLETKGQISRRNIQKAMLNALAKHCPENWNKLASKIAFEFHLTPDTVKYNYLKMFLDVGVIAEDAKGMISLTSEGMKLQDCDDFSFMDYVKSKKKEQSSDK